MCLRIEISAEEVNEELEAHLSSVTDESFRSRASGKGGFLLASLKRVLPTTLNLNPFTILSHLPTNKR